MGERRRVSRWGVVSQKSVCHDVRNLEVRVIRRVLNGRVPENSSQWHLAIGARVYPGRDWIVHLHLPQYPSRQGSTLSLEAVIEDDSVVANLRQVVFDSLEQPLSCLPQGVSKLVVRQRNINGIDAVCLKCANRVNGFIENSATEIATEWLRPSPGILCPAIRRLACNS